MSQEEKQQIKAVLNTKYDQVLQFFKSASGNQNLDFTKIDWTLVFFTLAISGYNSQLDLTVHEQSLDEPDLNF